MILYRALQVGKTCVCEIKKKLSLRYELKLQMFLILRLFFFKASFPEDW